jgi:hypothetical protein
MKKLPSNYYANEAIESPITEKKGVAAFRMWMNGDNLSVEVWTPDMEKRKHKTIKYNRSYPYVCEYYALFDAYQEPIYDNKPKLVHIEKSFIDQVIDYSISYANLVADFCPSSPNSNFIDTKLELGCFNDTIPSEECPRPIAVYRPETAIPCPITHCLLPLPEDVHICPESKNYTPISSVNVIEEMNKMMKSVVDDSLVTLLPDGVTPSEDDFFWDNIVPKKNSDLEFGSTLITADRSKMIKLGFKEVFLDNANIRGINLDGLISLPIYFEMKDQEIVKELVLNLKAFDSDEINEVEARENLIKTLVSFPYDLSSMFDDDIAKAVMEIDRAIDMLVEDKRICSATGEEMTSGYVYRDGEKYFKYEKDLVEFLRSSGDENYNDATDEFILHEAYMLGEYYQTSWED